VRRALVAAVAVALVAAANAGGGHRGFSANVTNPWFPLLPGQRLGYGGSRDGMSASDSVLITRRVAIIDGAPCRVVKDELYVGGRLVERTTDWYSQDAAGTVWYFGERTAELDRHGHVSSTEGSWRAGVHGARPGVYMPAHPRVGQIFAQEHAPGVAEDHFRIVRVDRPHDKALLETREWTPLEPLVLERKTYAWHIGQDVDETIQGGSEHLELLRVDGP
jgi:hypothetical protein